MDTYTQTKGGKYVRKERVPWGRSVGTNEGGRAIVHMPLPIPNHPQSVEYHCNSNHQQPNSPAQHRLHATPQHSPHCRTVWIAQLTMVG